jgi:hypothetical protein
MTQRRNIREMSNELIKQYDYINSKQNAPTNFNIVDFKKGLPLGYEEKKYTLRTLS